MNASASERLKSLGIELPPVAKPSYSYVPFKRDGDTIYISGQVPRLRDGSLLMGKLGLDCELEKGRQAARVCGEYLLAIANSVTGSLDDIEFVKVFGMVNAIPTFQDHPKVIDGCSQLLVDVLGSRGCHARSAVGMGSLPANVPVEIEAVARIVR